MRDRIVEFIEKEGVSAAEFADNIGVQRSSVSHVLNGRNNPGFSFIQKILESYPNLNSRWLLTGNGAMHEEKDTGKASIEPKPVPESDLFSTTATNKSSQSEMQPETHINPVFKDNSTENPKPDPSQKETKPPKKVVKVLIFYEDHTFEDFRPAE
ncbi:MAG: helix-turn-helix transcriptional regulator [Prolixibacteraceae bacterium]|jgi:transcriptional regulator with XRE-family HTH domain|nr:helix-turn-helix transcriptional regulator [Prolixibacteraceae bacterium]